MCKTLIYIAFLACCFSSGCRVSTSSVAVISVGTEPSPEAVSDPSPTDEIRGSLEKIWLEKDEFREGSLSISHDCHPKEEGFPGSCSLTVTLSGKNMVDLSSMSEEKNWLRYGFIDLLGNGAKQLVVFRYSGGGHCCYEYSVYDVTRNFRLIYSNAADAINGVGNELTAVDIDNDGILELRQDVMAFDYMGSGGHAGATFPPAVFAYDRNVGKYIPATAKFPSFVEEEMTELLNAIDQEKDIDQETRTEVYVRSKFLYMVYAGKRDLAWNYFDENYKSTFGNGYQEKFKEPFRSEFKEKFSNEPVYLSIYKN